MANPTDHYLLTGLDVHSTIWKTVADAAALAALTPAAEDIGKDVLQADDSSVHKLVETGPAVWKNITAAAAASTFTLSTSGRYDSGAPNTWIGGPAGSLHHYVGTGATFGTSGVPTLSNGYTFGMTVPVDCTLVSFAVRYAGNSGSLDGDLSLFKLAVTEDGGADVCTLVGTAVDIANITTLGNTYKEAQSGLSVSLNAGDGVRVFKRHTTAAGQISFSVTALFEEA